MTQHLEQWSLYKNIQWLPAYKSGKTIVKSGPTFNLSCAQAYSVQMQSWTVVSHQNIQWFPAYKKYLGSSAYKCGNANSVISQQKYPVVSYLEMLKHMLEQWSPPHNDNKIVTLSFTVSFDLFIYCWTMIIQVLLFPLVFF